jgi:hypothetical protein
MNWDWVAAILFFLALVILPRLILEWAWSRRLRAEASAAGGDTVSFAERRRPWIMFVGVGLLCAAAAIAATVLWR